MNAAQLTDMRLGIFGGAGSDEKKGKKQLRKLVKRKKHAQALKLGLELLKDDPYENDILFIVGCIYYLQGRYHQSVSYLGRSLDIAKYDSEALLIKAECHLHLGQKKESVKCCRMVQEVDPWNARAARIISDAKG